MLISPPHQTGHILITPARWSYAQFAQLIDGRPSGYCRIKRFQQRKLRCNIAAFSDSFSATLIVAAMAADNFFQDCESYANPPHAQQSPAALA